MIGTPTLGRYIGMRFLFAILAVFLLCSVLIYLIDFVELLRQSGKQGEVPLLTLALIALLRLPAYAEFLIAFAVLVGSITALLQLSRKSELTVMRAGGMSAWQFLRPGIIVAFTVGLLAVDRLQPHGGCRPRSRQKGSSPMRSAGKAICCARARAPPGCARTAPTANPSSAPLLATNRG